jgi:hypothetical protein
VAGKSFVCVLDLGVRGGKGSVAVPLSVELDETHHGWLGRVNPLLPRNGVQSGINVWKVICGDVADKRAYNLIVAHAAVQPAQEKDELHADGNERSQDCGPVDGHERSFLEKKIRR